jgi:hypothetical protein
MENHMVHPVYCYWCGKEKEYDGSCGCPVEEKEYEPEDKE